MRLLSRISPILFAFAAACSGDSAGPTVLFGNDQDLRVVNAFTTSVDVLVDGNRVATVPAGSIGTAAPGAGAHTVTLRASGSGSEAAVRLTTTTGNVNTIAAVRAASGGVSGIVLDDTNSVVPSGATKVRVLHLAPSAGILQVYRTQPDFQQPISWQFPFSYQAEPTSLSAPFYQSTVGSWEIRVWQSPTDITGWENAQTKVVIPLRSGQKKTVLILDRPGGGVRIELL